MEPPTGPMSASAESTPQPGDAAVIIENMGSQLSDYLGAPSVSDIARLALGPVAAIVVTIIFLVTGAYNAPNSLFNVGFIVIILVSYSASQARRMHERALMERFARANNFTFDQNGSVDETYGTIFKAGGTLRVSDVVTGTFHGHPLRLFMLRDTVQEGRSSRTYYDTVAEIDLAGKLPHVLLLNQKSHFVTSPLLTSDASGLGLAFSFGKSTRVSLEGDFNQYFTLLTAPGGEQAALEVFTPDLMALLEDEKVHYTVELIAGRIYVLSAGFLTTPESLSTLFAALEKLAGRLDPLAARLANDTTIPAPTVNSTILGDQSLLPSRINYKIIAIIVAVGIALPIIFGIAIVLTTR